MTARRAHTRPAVAQVLMQVGLFYAWTDEGLAVRALRDITRGIDDGRFTVDDRFARQTRRVTNLPPRLDVEHGSRPAHDLLREAAARFHEVPISQVVLAHECLRCGSDAHGRPVLLATAAIRRPAYVSLARAGEVSVVAVTDAGRVGIDVEAEGAAEFSGFAEVALHPVERTEAVVDPTRTWVRKEALLKAYGLGLAVDPSDLRLDDEGLAGWDSPHPAPGAVWLRDIDITGRVGAVAILPDVDLATLSVTVRPTTG